MAPCRSVAPAICRGGPLGSGTAGRGAEALIFPEPGDRYPLAVAAVVLAVGALVTVADACRVADYDESSEADIAAIRRFLDEASEAVNAGDVEAEVGRFTEDAIYMWPEAPSIQGHAALREWFQQRFARVEVRLESQTEEIEVSGSWAFERGTYVARIRQRIDGEVETVRGKYLNILRRRQDGSWRIARRIRNRDHPAAQP